MGGFFFLESLVLFLRDFSLCCNCLERYGDNPVTEQLRHQHRHRDIPYPDVDLRCPWPRTYFQPYSENVCSARPCRSFERTRRQSPPGRREAVFVRTKRTSTLQINKRYIIMCAKRIKYSTIKYKCSPEQTLVRVQ